MGFGLFSNDSKFLGFNYWCFFGLDFQLKVRGICTLITWRFPRRFFCFENKLKERGRDIYLHTDHLALPWEGFKTSLCQPPLSLECKWLPKRSECRISNRWSKNKYLISFKVFSKLQFSIPKRPPFVRQSCPLKILNIAKGTTDPRVEFILPK